MPPKHPPWVEGLSYVACNVHLLTINKFCTPNNLGLAEDYTRADPADLTPLTRTEQASIDTTFA
jgi:hypothetical protein